MSESHHDHGSSKKKSKQKKNDRMRETVASLHREMEVAPKKRITRDESTKRTKRRKKLEAEERREFEVQVDSTHRTRLRGSQAAYGDEVIHGSLIFPGPNRRCQKVQIPDKFSKLRGDALDPIPLEVGDDDEADGTMGGHVIEQQYGDVQGRVERNKIKMDADDDEIEYDEEDEDEDDGEEDVDAGADGKCGKGIVTANKKKATEDEATKRKRYETRRKRYRLKNFQSVRMAQRHGDALKYHARGQPKRAIEALKQVARDVPSAPQIYSSLGMVYEDMLKESFKKASPDSLQQRNESENVEAEQKSEMDPLSKEQLDLAKKAYGSYHVAAILCKQDYTLWVKAAGCAIQAAELHGLATVVKNLSTELRDHNRAERKRWFVEALGDLKVADKLKPPGIEVPVKLASIHMEVGKLSEVSILRIEYWIAWVHVWLLTNSNAS